MPSEPSLSSATVEQRRVAPTLVEVARGAGVSVSTASRVLNRGKHSHRISVASSERVRDVAKKLGYTLNYHARSIRLGRAEVIGIALNLYDAPELQVIPSAFGIPYFSWIVGGIELRARRYDHRISLISADLCMSAPDKGMIELRQRRLDGMIVFGTVLAPGVSNLLAEAPDAPVVVIQPAQPTEYPVVDFDDLAGIRLSVNHLAELGHRHVLWLGPDAQGGLAGVPNRRECQFVTACREAGLRGASCRFPIPTVATDEWDIMLTDSAHEAIAAHLATGDRSFTAIVAYNDATAMAAYAALGAAGLRVPTDVSVVGFDDTLAKYVFPRMTTVCHRFGQMGAAACDLMMKLIPDQAARKELRGHRTTVQPELVVRQSTARPRSSD